MNTLHRTWQACLALMLAVPIVGWFIYVLSGNAETYIVLISEIGINPPESYLFSVGYTTIAVLLIPLVFSIFQRNISDMPAESEPKLHFMNLVGLAGGLGWVIGFLLIANYDAFNDTEIHDFGAMLVFNSFLIAGIAWAYLDRRLSDAGYRSRSLTRKAFPILSVSFLMLLMLFASHEFAHWMHPEVAGYRNLGTDRGWFFFFALVEWCLAWTLAAVFWSFEPYFSAPASDGEE